MERNPYQEVQLFRTLKVRADWASIRCMKILKQNPFLARQIISSLVVAIASVTSLLHCALASSWSGIEPLKSRRADVERVLGRSSDAPREDGTMHFIVAGGTVTVSFVSAKFVANKKLRPEIEGTVLQIILQHESSSDTPDSMNLTKNRDFDHQDDHDISVYRNMKNGVAYTFIGGRLRTTRYAPSAEQLVRARK